jgi:hypothetical protein
MRFAKRFIAFKPAPFAKLRNDSLCSLGTMLAESHPFCAQFILPG